MTSFDELIENIRHLKILPIYNNTLSVQTALSNLKKVHGLLKSKNINTEEYLVHLWEEPDFQIRVLEEYSRSLINERFAPSFYIFHYYRSLINAINDMKSSLKLNQNITTAIKKFILDLNHDNYKLIKGIIIYSYNYTLGSKYSHNIALLRTKDFPNFRSANILGVTGNKNSHTKILKQFIRLRDLLDKDFVALENPLASFINRNKGIIITDEFLTSIENTTDISFILSFLSSGFITGNPHLYNEARGIIIEKIFDTLLHKDFRMAFLHDAFSSIFLNINSLKNSDSFNLAGLLNTASLFIRLQQIYYQIHRTGFYDILEKLKVIYLKNNFDTNIIFSLEKFLLFFDLLYTIMQCFSNSIDHVLSEAKIDFISEIFDSLVNFENGFIKKNISSFYEQIISLLESETQKLNQQMITDS